MSPAEWVFLTVLFVLPHVNATVAILLLSKERRNGR